MTLTNRGDLAITEVYVSPSSTDSWGEDRLGETVLEPRKSVRLRLGRMRDCGFDEVELPEASAARQPVEQWTRALGQISHGYQRGYGDSGNILDRRRSARLKHAAAG